MSKEAMQMALDVLLDIEMSYECEKEIEALCAALAQPESEPVAWWNRHKDAVSTDPYYRKDKDCIPLYTAPPQRKEWVGLTDEDKQAIFEACYDEELDFFSNDAALGMAEAKLKEKNT